MTMGRGSAFIVFGTVEAGCTSSRIALPQLEDKAKLCLTKTFSPPPPPLSPLVLYFCGKSLFLIAGLFSSLHCPLAKKK